MSPDGVSKKRTRGGDRVECPDRKRTKLFPVPRESLLGLLDLSGLRNVEQIQERFSTIAQVLLYQYRICLLHMGETTFYELLEIEFYWNNHSWHPDPFCHPGPRNFCEWHFHKAPRRKPVSLPKSAKPTLAGGFRGGTRKGLDLTFGPKDDALWSGNNSSQPSGGILLRSMRRAEDGTVISGPSLLVDEILRVFEAPNLKTLVSSTWNNLLFALHEPKCSESCMYLVENENIPVEVMFYVSPRVGLDLSNPDAKPTPTDIRVTFVGKLHRFFRHPELLTANGRLQTFVGLLCQSKGNNRTEASVNAVLATVGKFTVKSIEKYTSEFRAGQVSGKLEEFVGLNGKSTITASYYLRLMGTLHRLGLLMM